MVISFGPDDALRPLARCVFYELIETFSKGK
jgi:hypothetical protein